MTPSHPTDEPSEHGPDAERPDPELDTEDGAFEDTGDDTVIAVAFRRSLAVFAVLAAIALAVAWVVSREEGPGEEVTLETAAPVAVEETTTVPELPFTDVTAEWGVDFVHESGAEGEKLLPETMGSGVALFDADGDGDADVLFADGTRWPHGGERPNGSTRF
ncbi:MAG: hypothetical protein AAGE94_17260 [Acidobacteriota bacterium]